MGDKIRKAALLTLGMAALSSSMIGNPYNTKRIRHNYNPDYKIKSPIRELREFTVKGKKIMAYSKKDAIKRLKHQK
ncbi:hypothetical protein [Rudgehvirus jaberico]|uniref:Uncharacterized protein n=1 Tax=Caudoviricetes sp. 'Rudgehvirus jaberico' TaxID=3028515 RepID=A0AAF0D5J8_9CAUD|nr:hypothetical protein [Caudoviricetes sp. 'Rudgehvirus jaberico']